MSSSDALAKALEKEIGSNDEKQEVTDWLDTGFPCLNRIVSGRSDGGLGYGRLYEMYGPSSSGKCQPESTMVMSEYGMITFKELFEIEGYKTTCVQKAVEHKTNMINEFGEMEETSHLTWNGRRKTKIIRTSSGLETEATFNHPLRVINKFGDIVWKRAGDISIDDHLLVMRDTNSFGKSKLSTDVSKLIGYLVADGSMNNKTTVRFSNSDEDVIDEYKRIMKSDFGAKVVTHKKEGSQTTDHYTYDKSLRGRFSDEFGIHYVTAKDKEVPFCVRTSTRDGQISFLRGYFELECSIDTEKSCIEVTGASKKLASQIQLMLLNLGIWSRLSEKIVKGYAQKYWSLIIGANDVDKFVKIIGFETKDRLETVSRIRKSERNSCCDVIPNQREKLKSLYDNTESCRAGNDLFDRFIRGSDGLGYESLQKIVSYCIERTGRMSSHLLEFYNMLLEMNYGFDKVVEINNGECPTFDVTLPKTHSFWANGLVSHNTALATKLMIEAQRRGGVAIFVDYERTFDVGMAVKMGLVDKSPFWIYKAPKTWEQGNTLAMKACHVIRSSGAIDKSAPIIVVQDSIASAIPQSVFEKGIEEYNMNDNTALSRVASTTLKAVASFCNDYDTICLYLNQVRTKPGVVYGDNKTTPGGVSMEFYASGRIELSRVKIMEKEGDSKDKQLTAQIVRAKCVKSKHTRPCQTTELGMRFNDDGSAYFDEVEAHINYMIKSGKIDTSGAYIIWDGKKVYKSVLIKKIIEDGLANKVRDMAYAA